MSFEASAQPITAEVSWGRWGWGDLCPLLLPWDPNSQNPRHNRAWAPPSLLRRDTARTGDPGRGGGSPEPRKGRDGCRAAYGAGLSSPLCLLSLPSRSRSSRASRAKAGWVAPAPKSGAGVIPGWEGGPQGLALQIADPCRIANPWPLPDFLSLSEAPGSSRRPRHLPGPHPLMQSFKFLLWVLPSPLSVPPLSLKTSPSLSLHFLTVSSVPCRGLHSPHVAPTAVYK